MIFPRTRLAQGLAALALLASHTAQAGDDAALLDLLLCNPSADTARAAKASSALEARGRKLGRNGDNGLYLEAPIRSGNLCIEHATASGAFGVMMVSASVCGGNTGPLEAYLARSFGQLRPKAEPTGPGVIKAFEAGNFSIVIFHGAPGFDTGPDPASKTVSYICGLHGGGPQ